MVVRGGKYKYNKLTVILSYLLSNKNINIILLNLKRAVCKQKQSFYFVIFLNRNAIF